MTSLESTLKILKCQTLELFPVEPMHGQTRPVGQSLHLTKALTGKNNPGWDVQVINLVWRIRKHFYSQRSLGETPAICPLWNSSEGCLHRKWSHRWQWTASAKDPVKHSKHLSHFLAVFFEDLWSVSDRKDRKEVLVSLSQSSKVWGTPCQSAPSPVVTAGHPATPWKERVNICGKDQWGINNLTSAVGFSRPEKG